MKVVCVGHAAYDITIPVAKFPLENTKNRVETRMECGGGPASNAAYLLGKWGLETYFVGIVGNDLYGKIIKQEFDDVNVNTNYLELNSNYVTTSSFIIANREKGSRTILTYRPQEMEIGNVELDFEPDILLFDGQEYELSKKLLLQYPNAISIIDAGRPTEEIIELSKMVNYVVSSKEFAEEVSGVNVSDDEETLEKLYIKMKEQFKGTIVVTLESKGCLFEQNGTLNLMASIPVSVVDSTGAGDIFHGAFTYGIAKGMEFTQVLKLATITAGLSVTRLGGRNSIFTFDEIREYYHEFK